MSRNISPFGLRMPRELREELQNLASSNGRSLNAEIVFLLSDIVRTRDRAVVSHAEDSAPSRSHSIVIDKYPEYERTFLEVVRTLSARKRDALLVLLS